ncbi:MAG TPA: VOC family protein [Gemmatimonadaceae bacterium]
MSAPVMHFHFTARDRRKLASFYAGVFGWEPAEFAELGYTKLQTASTCGIDGGVSEAGALPAGVMVYAQVEDVEASLAMALSLGGRQLMEPYDIPGVGRFAVFSDPEGNGMGLWKVETTGGR